MTFQAVAGSLQAPVVAYQWDFGDGTSVDGAEAHHAYTRPGDYPVTLTVTGLDSVTNRKTVSVTVEGTIATRFEPSKMRRAE